MAKTIGRELAKIIGKKEPHLIEITLREFGSEPTRFRLTQQETHNGKTLKVQYSGFFNTREEVAVEQD